jgi:hypothetical protein
MARTGGGMTGTAGGTIRTVRGMTGTAGGMIGTGGDIPELQDG